MVAGPLRWGCGVEQVQSLCAAAIALGVGLLLGGVEPACRILLSHPGSHFHVEVGMENLAHHTDFLVVD